MANWTPSDLAVAPWLYVNSDNAVWSGSNLTSITNGGSGNNGSVTQSGTVTKGTVSNSKTPLRLNGPYLNVPQSAFGTGGTMFVFAVFKLLGSAGGLLNNNTWALTSGCGIYPGGGDFFSAWSGYNMYVPFNTPTNGPGYWNASGQPTSTTTITLQSWLASAAAVEGRVNTLAPSISDKILAAVPNYGAATWKLGEVGGGESLNADLFAVITLRYAPTTDERERLEGWASWTYAGDGSLLPIGHTYKSAAPTTSGSPYSLTADLGTFAETGIAAGLARGLKLTSATGAFTETGISAGLVRGYPMVAAVGAFTETGQSAGLAFNRVLTSAVGSMTLTGQAADLVYASAARTLAADTASFVLTGQDAGLTPHFVTNYSVVAEAAAFTLLGIDADLSWPARPFWMPVSPVTETWSAVSSTSETWSPVASTSETWTPQ